MKLLIISDIHGSSYYAKKILEIKKRENPDKIVLLGDLYYHGPRNMISDFGLKDNLKLDINGLKVFFTHGHKYNIDNLPEEKIDILIYGHFHTGFIKEKDGLIFANAGSISLPKNDTKNSYLILDEKELILKDLDGNIIDKKEL